MEGNEQDCGQLDKVDNKYLRSICDAWVIKGSMKTEGFSLEFQNYRNPLMLFSCKVLSNSLQPHGLQHAKLCCPSLSHLAWPNCHPTICHPLLLPSILPSIRVFSNESVLCISGQSILVSASASVLPMNNKDCFPLGWTGWISSQSKGLSRVFSSTTNWNDQFFNTQPSLWSDTFVCDYWKNHRFD